MAFHLMHVWPASTAQCGTNLSLRPPLHSLCRAYVNVRTTQQGFSPLHLAASVGGTECIEALLSSNADIEARDWLGSTPLVVAAAADQPKAVRLLLKNGANVQAVSESGKSAIHSAAHAGSADCLRLLLDAGANIEVRSAAGLTPAHRAAAQGHDAALRLLLRAGADANAASTGPGAETPLMVAARRGHESCVEALLKHRLIHTDARDASDWVRLLSLPACLLPCLNPRAVLVCAAS